MPPYNLTPTREVSHIPNIILNNYPYLSTRQEVPVVLFPLGVGNVVVSDVVGRPPVHAV